MSARAAKPEQSRRSFLGSSAAMAAALSATAAPTAAIGGAHPDAELFDLGAQLDAAEKRLSAISAEMDEAYERIALTTPIEAVRWRPGDFMSICLDRRRDCERWGDGPDAFWFYDEGSFAARLRENLISWKEEQTKNQDYGLSDRSVLRAEEILAGIDMMNAENKAAEDESGFTALQEAEDAEQRTIRDLKSRMLAMTATTMAGMAVKAQIALYIFADPRWQHRLPELLADMIKASVADSDHWPRTAAFALSIDIARMGDLLPATTDRATA